MQMDLARQPWTSSWDDPVGAGVVVDAGWGCLPPVLPDREAVAATKRRWQDGQEQHRPGVERDNAAASAPTDKNVR